MWHCGVYTIVVCVADGENQTVLDIYTAIFGLF